MILDPETTPVPPEALKLKMMRRQDGQILCVVYVEYRGKVPEALRANILHVEGTPTDDDLVQHVLDFEVVFAPEDAQTWFAKVRETQPWIKRN